MATRVLLPREQVFSNIGNVGSGYRLFFYETGTSTKKDTYSNESLTTPNANPIVADSAGRFGDIWISDSTLYKCVLAPAGTDDPSTNPIWTADPINANNSGIIIIDPLPAAYWGITSGTSTSYTLDIPDLLVPITSYSNKQCFFIDFHIACGANPTLNVNNLGAANLKKKTGQGTKTALQANDIQVGRYIAFNDGTDIVVYNTRGEPLYLGTAITLIAAANAVTINNVSANYNVDTSSAAVTLNTISGMVAGQLITLGISSASNALTLTSGVGNIINPNSSSVILSSVNDKVTFLSDGTNAIITSVSSSTTSPIQLLETKTASASATIDFVTGINSNFSKYRVELLNVIPVTDNVYFKSQLSNNGVTFNATTYVGIQMNVAVTGSVTSNSSSSTHISISSEDIAGNWGIENTANNGFNGIYELNNPSETATFKSVYFRGSWDNNGGNYSMSDGIGRYEGSTSAIQGIRFFFSSGNIASGIFKLYGIK